MHLVAQLGVSGHLGTVSGAAAALSGHDTRIVAALVSLTYLGSVADTVTDDPSVLTTAIASLLGYAGYVHATGRFARYLRGSATEIDRPTRTVSDRARGSRSHASVFARIGCWANRHSMPSTSSLWVGRTTWTLQFANASGTRPRNCGASSRAAYSTTARLEMCCRALSRSSRAPGFVFEFVAADLLNEPAPACIAVFAAAIRAALDNVAQHAGTTQVVLRVDATPDRLEVNVHDYGVRFDSHGPTSSGHGIERLIVTPLDDIGGRAEVRDETWARSAGHTTAPTHGAGERRKSSCA